MKIAYLSVLVAMALQGCSTTTRQVFSNAHGRYVVDWCGKKVCRIEFKGAEVPDGRLRVTITRRRDYKKVQINGEHDAISGHEIMTPSEDRGSYAGDVGGYGESHYTDSERVSVQEWRLLTNQVVIYKEIIVEDADDKHLKRLDFFGPFNVPLEPPTDKK